MGLCYMDPLFRILAHWSLVDIDRKAVRFDLSTDLHFDKDLVSMHLLFHNGNHYIPEDIGKKLGYSDLYIVLHSDKGSLSMDLLCHISDHYSLVRKYKMHYRSGLCIDHCSNMD